MAKKKTEELDIDSLFASIAEKTGGDVLDSMENVKSFFDTGNLSINYSCSGKYIAGGVAQGKISEWFGPEASGKSLIGSNILFSCQQIGGWPVLLDCENASNGEFMQRISHLNLKRVFRYAPSSLERAFRQIHVSVREIRETEKKMRMTERPILFVFDSLTVPPCERELRENDLPLDYSVADWKKLVGSNPAPGERAKIISAEMRKLQSMVAEQNVSVYIVNQTRDKIGVLYGSPETTPGGNAVKFYSSLRVRTQAKKKIEHSKLEKFAGINMQVKNVKNRSFSPFVIADDVKLYFDSGIDPVSGLLTSLISAERILQKGAGNYEVSQNYLPDSKDEYKFKASKEENRIAISVLLDCPKLIDANNSTEVQEYLDVWSSGLAATESGEYKEKDGILDADGDIDSTGDKE